VPDNAAVPYGEFAEAAILNLTKVLLEAEAPV